MCTREQRRSTSGLDSRWRSPVCALAAVLALATVAGLTADPAFGEEAAFVRLCKTSTSSGGVAIAVATNPASLRERWVEFGFGDCGGEPGLENQPPPVEQLDENIVVLVSFRPGSRTNDVTSVDLEGTSLRVSVVSEPEARFGEVQPEADPTFFGSAVAVPRSVFEPGRYTAVMVLDGLERASTTFEVGELAHTGSDRATWGVFALFSVVLLGAGVSVPTAGASGVRRRALEKLNRRVGPLIDRRR